ncbi:hypothetical protein I7I48_09102 [Histoplasma ohiense]|nr:hypothetical protein I7I48_09102 [Histoplasma ohiense (nom. inval.)]
MLNGEAYISLCTRRRKYQLGSSPSTLLQLFSSLIHKGLHPFLSSFCEQDLSPEAPDSQLYPWMPPSRFTSTRPQRKHLKADTAMLEMSIITSISAIIVYFRTNRFGKRLSSASEQRKATMSHTDPESLPIILF